MRAYAIAKFLTDEDKARALSGTYRLTEMDQQPPAFRDEDGRCPLGRALGTVYGAPSARDVESFFWYRRDDGRAETIHKAAQTFIRAWDDGRIPPEKLPEALGVEP